MSGTASRTGATNDPRPFRNVKRVTVSRTIYPFSDDHCNSKFPARSSNAAMSCVTRPNARLYRTQFLFIFAQSHRVVDALYYTPYPRSIANVRVNLGQRQTERCAEGRDENERYRIARESRNAYKTKKEKKYILSDFGVLDLRWSPVERETSQGNYLGPS